MSKIIGLTGNSGSGKGAVALILKEKGCLVLDCDKIAHSNMEPKGSAYEEIIAAFGNDIVKEDNTIDRKKLAAVVFGDRAKLRLLNSITHKHIENYIVKAINENKLKYDCIVIDAPLLIEASLDRLCDCIWLIYADEKTRLQRVMNRDNITEEEALMRFKNQTPFDALKNYADFIIDNSGGFENLKNWVEKGLSLFGE